jgi:hypothetical protein
MGLLLIYMVVIFGIALLLALLFLNSLSQTLKAISARNRAMQPEKVWLLLIPVFQFYWLFVVITRLSASIHNEYKSRGLGIEESPTYFYGLIWSTLFVTNTLIGCLYRWGNCHIFSIQNPLVKMLSTAGTIAWIAYWLKVNGYRKHLRQLPSHDSPRSNLEK